MSKIIDKSADDKAAGIRFHMSSARMSMKKLSYVAFQRFLDEVERSMYRCPECGWHGKGRDLLPMEMDENESHLCQENADTWYGCPKCQAEIDVEHAIMKSVD